jgi:hypothetical protein
VLVFSSLILLNKLPRKQKHFERTKLKRTGAEVANSGRCNLFSANWEVGSGSTFVSLVAYD